MPPIFSSSFEARSIRRLSTSRSFSLASSSGVRKIEPMLWRRAASWTRRLRDRESPSSLAHTLTFWWTSTGLDYYLGYLDNLAVGSLVDPIQSIPVWCGRTELVHQSHGCGCRRMAIHQRAQQVADRAAQRSKLIQPMGGHRAHRPRELHVVDAEPGEEVRGCGEPIAHLAIDREDGADELEC